MLTTGNTAKKRNGLKESHDISTGGINHLDSASDELIDKVKGKQVFSPAKLLWAFKGVRSDEKNNGTPQMTRRPRELLAAKAFLRNVFSYAPNKRVPG